MDKSFSDIDLGRLDEEWVRQPKRYNKYAAALADAKKDHSEAKAALEVVEAEVKQQVRKNPTKYGLKDKPTEGAINEIVTLHLDYRKATTAMIEARHKVDVLEGAVNTLEHRKRALESLVTLHGQSYFSTPRVKSQNDADGKIRDSMADADKRKLRGGGLKRRKKG